MKSTKILAWSMLIGIISILFYIIGMLGIAFEAWVIGAFGLVLFFIGIIISFVLNCIFIYKELVVKDKVQVKRK